MPCLQATEMSDIECGTCRVPGSIVGLLVNYRGELACCACASHQRKWTPLAIFDWTGQEEALKPFRARGLLTWNPHDPNLTRD